MQLTKSYKLLSISILNFSKRLQTRRNTESIQIHRILWKFSACACVASYPDREGGGGKAAWYLMLRMRRVFRILSSKLDHKVNHPRRASTILRSKVNIYGTIIRRVYGEYTITNFLGYFGACTNIRYQAAFPPPPSRPGYEASACSVYQALFSSPA